MARNITVSVPDDVHRKARVVAAQQGRSLSGLVQDFLVSLADDDGEFRRLEALQRRVQAQVGDFRGADRRARDELHDRALR